MRADARAVRAHNACDARAARPRLRGCARAEVMLFLHGNAEDLGMSFTFVRHMRDQFKVNVPALP